MYRIITFFLFRICVLSALSAQEMIFVKAQPGDATPRLQAAIEQAHRLKGKKVVIQLEQGDYHLYRKSSSKQVYFISNTASEEENPDPTKHIGLWIKDMTNLIIDGGGAHLIAPENDRPNGSVHKGIRIENNRFELKDKQAIYARWTDHIHISGNYFNGMFPDSKQEYILLEHCTHVENLQSKYPAK